MSDADEPRAGAVWEMEVAVVKAAYALKLKARSRGYLSVQSRQTIEREIIARFSDASLSVEEVKRLVREAMAAPDEQPDHANKRFRKLSSLSVVWNVSTLGLFAGLMLCFGHIPQDGYYGVVLDLVLIRVAVPLLLHPATVWMVEKMANWQGRAKMLQPQVDAILLRIPDRSDQLRAIKTLHRKNSYNMYLGPLVVVVSWCFALVLRTTVTFVVGRMPGGLMLETFIDTLIVVFCYTAVALPLSHILLRLARAARLKLVHNKILARFRGVQ